MTSFPLRGVAIGLFAVAACAAQAAAQAAQSPVLTSLEVRQLVARGQPSDHARLRDHFLALSARYAADAGQHTAMAAAFLENPGGVRVRAQSASDHCVRLADLAAQSAATVRQLAACRRCSPAAVRGDEPPQTILKGGVGSSMAISVLQRTSRQNCWSTTGIWICCRQS